MFSKRSMGGMALRAPVLAALFLIVALATLAMPGSANFIGEFYILNGLFDSKIVCIPVGREVAKLLFKGSARNNCLSHERGLLRDLQRPDRKSRFRHLRCERDRGS